MKKVLQWLFGRILDEADPRIGKTVIHFTTHGCMGQIDEFDYIGTIIKTVFPEHCNGKMFYKIEILKDRNGEKRDNTIKEPFILVASWYLQNLGGDFFIAYD